MNNTFIIKTLSLISFLMLLCGMNASAQETGQDFQYVYINGLRYTGFYTAEEIEAALGKPDAVEDYGYMTYCYRMTVTEATHAAVKANIIGEARQLEDCFSYVEVNEGKKQSIVAYVIVTDRFALNGHVRVGDPVSKVREMGGDFQDYKRDEGGGRLVWRPYAFGNIPWNECPKFYYDSKGIITGMSCYYD